VLQIETKDWPEQGWGSKGRPGWTQVLMCCLGEYEENFAQAITEKVLKGIATVPQFFQTLQRVVDELAGDAADLRSRGARLHRIDTTADMRRRLQERERSQPRILQRSQSTERTPQRQYAPPAEVHASRPRAPLSNSAPPSPFSPRPLDEVLGNRYPHRPIHRQASLSYADDYDLDPDDSFRSEIPPGAKEENTAHVYPQSDAYPLAPPHESYDYDEDDSEEYDTLAALMSNGMQPRSSMPRSVFEAHKKKPPDKQQPCFQKFYRQCSGNCGYDHSEAAMNQLRADLVGKVVNATHGGAEAVIAEAQRLKVEQSSSSQPRHGIPVASRSHLHVIEPGSAIHTDFNITSSAPSAGSAAPDSS
jgi:hypothetical protein